MGADRNVKIDIGVKALGNERRERLYQMLASHDYFYEYSDDYNVRRSGRAEWSALSDVAKDVGDKDFAMYKSWHAPQEIGGAVHYTNQTPMPQFGKAREDLRQEMITSLRNGSEALYYISRSGALDIKGQRAAASTSASIALVMSDPNSRAGLTFEQASAMADPLKKSLRECAPHMDEKAAGRIKGFCDYLGSLERTARRFEKVAEKGRSETSRGVER